MRRDGKECAVEKPNISSGIFRFTICLITVKAEFAPRNPHHNGKPFAASLVVQYRRLEILIKRIVWFGAELGSAKRQKRFFVMPASQFTTAVTGRCVCVTTIIPL